MGYHITAVGSAFDAGHIENIRNTAASLGCTVRFCPDWDSSLPHLAQTEILFAPSDSRSPSMIPEMPHLKWFSSYYAGVDPLVVPDGAVLFYNIDSPEQMHRQLLDADEKIGTIRSAIEERKPSSITGSAAAGKAMLASYHACMGTGKFHALDRCIGCGLCAKNCVMTPSRINMVKSKDRKLRKAKKCDLCRNREEGPACIRYCPSQCLGLSKSAPWKKEVTDHE